MLVCLVCGCGGGGGGDEASDEGGGMQVLPPPPSGGSGNGGDCTGDLGCSCYRNDTCNGELECVAGTCAASTSCEGGVGCACYPNGTCDAGLSCQGGACVSAGSAGSGAPPAGGSGGGEAGAGGAPPPAADAPRFLSFSTNLTTLTKECGLGSCFARESAVFSAVLTDPDGIDDLIGGSLKDPDSGAAYGTFATDAGEGAYSLTLTWDAINAVHPIEGKGGASIVFRAEFFDQGGHAATQDVTLMFECMAETAIDVCDGDCTETDVDYENCGSCGRACDAAGPDVTRECHEGKCAYYAYSDEVTTATCSAYCTSLGGLACDPAASRLSWWNDNTSQWCTPMDTTGCNLDKGTTMPPPMCTLDSITCACTDP